MPDDTETTQQVVVHYVLPFLALLLAWGSPAIVFSTLARGTVISEFFAATRRRLSFVSLVVIGLSPILFMSNWDASALCIHAAYCVLLSIANLVADRLGKVRGWPVLLIWHAFNLINLIGGGVSFLQPYKMDGIIRSAESISPKGLPGFQAPSCNYVSVSWCSDTWIAIQEVTAFIYVVLHALAFFIVGIRVSTYFGGDADVAAPSVSESAMLNSGSPAGPF